MNYILPLVIGFLASFLGFLAPSMLNMTTARISIEKGKKEGIRFALGASSIVFIQSFLAVTFTKYLVEILQLSSNLKQLVFLYY